MTGHRESNDLHSYVAGYVCDALSPDEHVAFEEHLTQCGPCRTEVAELSEATVGLVEAVATPAPAALRAAVLADIAQVRPLPPPTPTSPPDQKSAQAAAPTVRTDRPATASAVTELDAHRRPRRSRAATLALAAALLVAAVMGGALWRQTAAQDQVVAGQNAAEVSQQRMRDLVASPDAIMRRVELPDGGRGTFILSPKLREGVFLGDGLANPGPGREYQVWTMVDGQSNPSIHFDATTGREAWMAGDMTGVTELALTVEPAGGSPQPTGKMLARTAL